MSLSYKSMVTSCIWPTQNFVYCWLGRFTNCSVFGCTCKGEADYVSQGRRVATAQQHTAARQLIRKSVDGSTELAANLGASDVLTKGHSNGGSTRLSHVPILPRAARLAITLRNRHRIRAATMGHLRSRNRLWTSRTSS